MQETSAIENPWQINNISLIHHENIRIKRNPVEILDLPPSFSWDSIFPKNEEKIKKRKRRIRKKGLRGQGSNPKPYHVSKTTPKPSAIFFPTNEDEGCAEATAVGSGFNTFGFLGIKMENMFLQNHKISRSLDHQMLRSPGLKIP